MKSEGMESQVKKLNKTIRKLEARMQKTEDIEAIKKLQDSYGYYLEHWQEEDLIALFSHNENVAVEINDFGLFKGWEGIKSCYHFEDHYPNYPGLKGRWYGYFLGAQRREGELRALIGCGIWENDFIKEDGIWRILKIFWNDIISSPLDEGWVKTPDMLNPKHKDAPPAGPNTTFLHYPSGYIFPYHYKNPVTGK